MWRVEQLLLRSELSLGDGVVRRAPGGVDEHGNSFETEIEWLLVAKATMQIYGAMLQTLIDQNNALDDHSWYWNDVSRSYKHGFILWVQKSPLRLWSFTRDVYDESAHRIQRLYSPRQPASISDDEFEEDGAAVNGTSVFSTMSLSQRWTQFYGIVRATVQDRSLVNIQDRILSPIALCQAEAREKGYHIRRLKENVACGIGTLIHEGLDFDGGEWKDVIERSISLMETVLVETPILDGSVSDFEERIFRAVDNDPELANHVHEDPVMPPRRLASRLLGILQYRLPREASDTKAIVYENGRPSVWVRYWL
ncbi:hypothetical protein IMZ48_28780, partial [Candidatus Bathyarchaeota archaeon]|nr:hypothetical protein [Candidatus Bathyarchaeota archaeon]